MATDAYLWCMRKIPGTEHPRPFESVLWEHLEMIKSLRKKRFTWKQVSDELGGKGVIIHPTSCCLFYNRFLKRDDFPGTIQHLLKTQKSKIFTSKPVDKSTPVLNSSTD
jgi:hypothetical protein